MYYLPGGFYLVTGLLVVINGKKFQVDVRKRNDFPKIYDLAGIVSRLPNQGVVQKELSLSYLLRNQDPSWAPATLYWK